LLFDGFWDKCLSLQGQWLELRDLTLWVKLLCNGLKSLHVEGLLGNESLALVALELGRLTFVAVIVELIVEAVAAVASPISLLEGALLAIKCLTLIWTRLILKHVVLLGQETFWSKRLPSSPDSLLLLN